MTKVIKSWRERLLNYLQKSEKETKARDKKILILNLLKDNLTTEESVDLFSKVSEIFYTQMSIRLNDIDKEKSVLNQFFNVKN